MTAYECQKGMTELADKNVELGKHIDYLRQCCKDFQFILEGSVAIKGQTDEQLEARENALERAIFWDDYANMESLKRRGKLL